jgi:hypothetical protein
VICGLALLFSFSGPSAKSLRALADSPLPEKSHVEHNNRRGMGDRQNMAIALRSLARFFSFHSSIVHL